MNALEVRGLCVARGGSLVIDNVSLDVGPGEAVCLLGRNGMGKTTLLRALMGLERARAGSVRLEGVDLTGRPPHVVARAGLGYVPQGRGVFPEHTVKENLLVGLRRGRDPEPLLHRVYSLFPVLAERCDQLAGTLSGGEQQMLAIGRCLVLEPKVLLLDEPTEGLQPSVVRLLESALDGIRTTLGISILLVEQNLDFAFAVTHRGYVLERGRVVADAGISTLREEAIIKEYLVV
ncbi:MAG TPA: ABC transporter ATP-binding protein [Actinomycetota bacterium]|nr:ABC transporter ATP-binding protein [Actinomycetota bacterium]